MKMKKRIAVVLSLVLMLSCTTAANPEVISAKTKLNKSKLTLYVGKTSKLKVKGAKKVKWSSNKKSVATVSSKGVVRAKKAGKAKITAKVGKKKYTCNVTVKGVAPVKKPANTTNANTNPAVPNVVVPTSAPAVTPAPNVENNTSTVSNSTLAANMGIITQPLADGSVLFTVTNNNNSAVSYYTINYQLKDSSGTVIYTGYTSGHAIAPGASQYLYDSVSLEDVQKIDVTKSIISITADNSITYTDARASVTVTSSKTTDGNISLTYTNSDTMDVHVDVIVLFYDANKKVIGASTDWEPLEGGAQKFSEVYVPRDYSSEDYSAINYASMETFVYAYKL